MKASDSGGVSAQIDALLSALSFAAEKHSGQLRKNGGPYINHPIAVAELLARVGRISDVEILQAALLHDLLEDTATSPQELAERFGRSVSELVAEVSDNMEQPKEERKRRQIETAGQLSVSAQQIRVADKICNVQQITPTEPPGWSLERKRAYLGWAEQVVQRCSNSSPELRREFEKVLDERRRGLDAAG